MENETTPHRIQIENRRAQLDELTKSPEVGIKARFAQEFGHIAIRHAHNEIPTADYDRFHELYVEKLLKHSLEIDRAAVARDFDYWTEAMLPAAQADIYEALIEQGVDKLPEFESPLRMSEMATYADDKLLHENLRLSDENARFMAQLAGMSRERRAMIVKLQKLQDAYDDLVIRTGGLVETDVLTDR